MKKTISNAATLVFILFSSGCGQSKIQPTEVSTLQPTFPVAIINTATESPLPAFTSTSTATPKPTVTTPPTLQAQWLTLPAPTISAQNISNLKFQTALNHPGVTKLSLDGQFLASAAYSQVVLYDFRTLKEIMRYEEAEGPGESEFYDIQFSSDSRFLAAIYNNVLSGGVRIWRTSEGTLSSSVTDIDWVYSLSFSPDNSLLALGTAAGVIVLLETEKYEVLRYWEAHSWIVDDLAFSPDGILLASVSRDKTFGLWQVSDGKQLYQASGQSDQPYMGLSSVAFSPNGKYIVVGATYGFIYLYTIGSNLEIRLEREWEAEEPGRSVNDVAFSRDSSILVSSSYSGVEFWAMPDCSLLRMINRAGGGLTFSSDGSLLLMGNEFWTVK